MDAQIERSGESWQNFLKQYHLTNIVDDDQGWLVSSISGNTYRVRSHARIDDMGSMYFRMSCTCPARRECRHIKGVVDMRHAEARMNEDYDALEIIERTEWGNRYEETNYDCFDRHARFERRPRDGRCTIRCRAVALRMGWRAATAGLGHRDLRIAQTAGLSRPRRTATVLSLVDG